MADDNFDEDAFMAQLFEQWEGDLNDSYELFRAIADYMLSHGKIVPSVVAGP